MAAKGSYWGKHKEKIHGDAATQAEKQKPIALPGDVKKSFEDGQVILIDKSLHWTSFDAVRKIRNAIRIKKVGHAGTLDPLATGLLIVCTGKFTKKINEYMAREKTYTGSFTLGATTPTYDLESEPGNEKPFTHITEDMLLAQVKQFSGEISQVPPIYSAIKKDGIAAYELARRGTDVELKPRNITIYHFEITGVALPVVEFKVTCSTGTYIRSLAHDFGAALGCGAHLSALRRTHIGEFDVKDALTIDDFIAELQRKAGGTDSSKTDN